MVQVNDVLSHFTLLTNFHKAYLLNAQTEPLLLSTSHNRMFSAPLVEM